MKKTTVKSKVKSKGKIAPGEVVNRSSRALAKHVASANEAAEPEVPLDVDRVLTPEVRALLTAIPDPHAAKKRYTVMRLAFARATQVAWEDIFEHDPAVCNQRVWYQKWQYDPEIERAMRACQDSASACADGETVRQELLFARDRKRAVAKYAASAPAALAAVMSGGEQRGSDRINAAMKLIGLADGAAADGGIPAGVFAPVGSGDNLQQVKIGDDFIDAAIERELAQLASRKQTGDAAPAEATAPPEPPRAGG